MSPVVLALMWVFAPITWPIAKLLDYLLGEDHGTTYKKAGLKTLVTLHKTMGTTPGERLNEDEVAIISGVLDLKAKPVGSIMTPMEDVFTLSLDACLDEEMIENIMREGYSRIPIHDPGNKDDFVGMLLVKMLITYDPEDARRVSEFPLATLPETRPDTSCLDIINFFQEGKSHMVLVSDHPAESFGALGVVTLEDVIEELIGEEIIDESDVFVDIHKAIRRLQPAPTYRHRVRVQKGEVVEDNNSQAVGDERHLTRDGTDHRTHVRSEDDRIVIEKKRGSMASIDLARSPRATTFLMRRGSATGQKPGDIQQVRLHQYTPEMKAHLRNLGPSNAASRPKQTRINTVKVKPGVGTISENGASKRFDDDSHDFEISPFAPDSVITPEPTAAQEGVVGSLVSPGKDASDGVQAALQAGYGTLDSRNLIKRTTSNQSKSRGVQADVPDDANKLRPRDLIEDEGLERPGRLVVNRSGSHSTIGSLHSQDSYRHRGQTARSGSITENIIESGGVKKLVLEPTSSSEDADVHDSGKSKPQSKVHSRATSQEGRITKEHANPQSSNSSQQKRKKRSQFRKQNDVLKEAGDENTPLLP